MDKQQLNKFEEFLPKVKKRKSGKRLGERTIYGIITLAKFLPEDNGKTAVEELRQKYKQYMIERDYPIAKYTLWMYLQWKGYDEEIIKKVVKFRIQDTITAINDEEKLAESVLSKKEIVALINSTSNPRDRLIFRLLYDTGARVSEICNVTLEDVDMENKEISIMGKGRKPRQVFFHDETKKELDNFIKIKTFEKGEKIFNVTPMTVWYNLKKHGVELLQKNVHPHMLRHSRLQHFADDGVDAFSIKAYAGHSDIRTTQIYVKASKYQRKIAFEKGGNIWEDLKKNNQV